MANPLTGEHDAVLQVSAGTINRLLATMHQNEGVTNVALPTLPHSAFLRIGDDPAKRVDGVQGSVQIQVGVPQVELFHLAQDRIAIRVWVRAWFTRASGSAPFPEFAYGVLRAEYGLKEIAGIGGPHALLYYPPRFRFEVDATHVSFKSEGDTSHDAAIARQIVAVLKRAFSMPEGHPMFEYMMDKKLISLSAGGNQAVAVGLELFPGPGVTERPKQITNIITGGRDFAVGASRDYILSMLKPQLDALKATTINVHVQALFVLTADYTVTITTATAQWGLDTITSGGVTAPCAALDFTIEGKGETSSIAPNGTFTIRHRILLAFNPTTHSLYVTPKGGPDVSSHFGGIGLVESKVESAITSAYNTQVGSALTTAAAQLAGISQFGIFLDSQLKLSDDQATSTIDAAEFTMDGLILRGSVALTPRSRGVVLFYPLPDATGYGAFLSWFPGGRITTFHWSWSLDVISIVAIPPQQRDLTDRFIVQPEVAMPGLPSPTDGTVRGGQVCLGLEGMVIDPTTGAEVRKLTKACVSVQLEPPRFLEDLASARLKWQLGANVVVEAGQGTTAAPPFNTLLYYVASDGPASFAAIVHGIESAQREDAGLLMVAVVPEGLDEAAVSPIRDAAPHGELIVHLLEDTSADWARAFHAPSGEALRLVTADGRMAWSHDGPIEAATLSAALRERLITSPAPRFVPLRPTVDVGSVAPLEYLQLSSGERLSLVQMRGRPVTLCFALRGVDSSLEQVRRLQAQPVEETGRVVVVLTDGDAAASTDLGHVDAPHMVVVPDPHRSLTDAFGVRVWPTTITLDENGVVASVESGFHTTHMGAASV